MNTLALLFVLLTFNTWAAESGSGAGNGGGIAEQNFMFVHANLTSYLESCLASKKCVSDETERTMLSAIHASLPAEGLALNQLVFKSGASEPEFFKLDGLVRTAKTGDAVGSKVFINTDLLYAKEASGQITPLGIPAVAAVLVHELGHHHGVRDHQFLDALGSKLRVLLLEETQRTRYFMSEVVLTTINSIENNQSTDEKSTQVLLEDGAVLHDLNPALRAQLACPDGLTLGNFYLWNVHWGTRRYTDPDKSVTYLWPVRGSLELQCLRNGDRHYYTGLALDGELAFRIDRQTGRFVYLPELTRFKTVADSVVLDVRIDLKDQSCTDQTISAEGGWTNVSCGNVSVAFSTHGKHNNHMASVEMQVYRNTVEPGRVLIGSPTALTNWNSPTKVAIVDEAGTEYGITVTPKYRRMEYSDPK